MALPFKLIDGFGPLVVSALDPQRASLWRQLPRDYQRFLLFMNGGLAESGQYEFASGVPYRTETANVASRYDSVVELFGLEVNATGQRPPSDLLESSLEHQAEQFLPTGVLAIASCVQNSLICVSLREDTFGSVWYWDWYWRYPWCKWFFDARIESVMSRHPGLQVADLDGERPEHRKFIDELNFATLVKLADTFDQWLSCVEDRTGKDADGAGT